MFSSRVVPILSLLALALAALVYGLMGKKNQTLDGVIVQNFSTYQFYPNAKECSYQGTPYLVLPNEHFHGFLTTSTDVEHIDRLFHGVWRAKLNGNLSRVSCLRYRKTYWRELSVNYIVDAVSLSCGETH